ncbi:hypothetical protein ACFP1I_00920 [Dyadobacter subterraneus]|uniref:Uncharacterized protein n=1 Tax=Dyadobacter subterraneus TaxID=2773304 RepID=A0ABR9W774_9BACT|nr:hypothetical protein [Dyadobacter subterraneus]MBE9461315.1 hypothetical protein [Dyadobacter subterraneus]
MHLIEKTKQLFKEKLDTISQLDFGWDNRLYDFYLIFGQNEENKSPWITTNWESDFEPYFNLLIKQTARSNDSGIRATKYKPEKRFSKKDNKEFIYHSSIRLGKLKWDNKSHGKWTTPDNIENYFLNFELWTPTWTICDKRQSPPDIYISMTNQRDFENKLDIKFGYFIVVAIAKNLQIDSKPILKNLSERINSKATIFKTRKWGKPEKAGNWTFSNWIQDTFSNGIYKGQSLHTFDFGELEFEPVWEIIYRQK